VLRELGRLATNDKRPRRGGEGSDGEAETGRDSKDGWCDEMQTTDPGQVQLAAPRTDS